MAGIHTKSQTSFLEISSNWYICKVKKCFTVMKICISHTDMDDKHRLESKSFISAIWNLRDRWSVSGFGIIAHAPGGNRNLISSRMLSAQLEGQRNQMKLESVIIRAPSYRIRKHLGKAINLALWWEFKRAGTSSIKLNFEGKHLARVNSEHSCRTNKWLLTSKAIH